ncbi:MAG: ATP-binding protein [Bacteroidota bacterium]|nr:ATP-binding protein [Bacteroidota bacterium]
MKGTFSITPRIIAHFGEDLIKNESIALFELVKNAYDACATECKINFKVEGSDLVEITIEDNGFGMDKNVITDVWLVIGTDFKYQKAELKPNCCGRYPLGEKGIGRLGVHKLGNEVTLISKKETESEVEVHIDWTKLLLAENIEDFEVDIKENTSPTIFKNGSTGTKIIIKKLKTTWDRRQIREVYRNLTSLNSPFTTGNDAFSVKVISNNTNLFAGLPSFTEIFDSGLYYGHCFMKGGNIEQFTYEFKPWSSLTKIDKGRKKDISGLIEQDLIIQGDKIEVEIDSNGRIKTKKVPYDIDLDEYKIGDIEFDVVIYEMDSQIFNFVNAEKTSIKSYLKENGGIRVYRDEIRVYDYGERDNDWLGIDLKRVHRVGGNVSNNIILGSVKINRADSSGLKEKTNREGFIENESYKAFVDAVNYALSLIVRERNIDKVQLTTLYKKHRAVEPVLADLDDVIEIVKAKVTVEEDREEILNYLYRINKQYVEVKEILIKSANAGLNLGVVIHEIEKQLQALMGLVENGGSQDQIKDITFSLEKIVRGYSAMIRKSGIENNSLKEVVQTVTDNYEFRFIDHSIEVFTSYSDNNLSGFLAKAESISVLTNLLDNSIFWLSYARKENRKISIFATDQIKDYNTIIVSDNGPGFNIPHEVATQPFISGKPNNIGMGLGLHVVNEMMNAMKGKLLFLEKEDVEFPKLIIENGITQAIVALCFPLKK